MKPQAPVQIQPTPEELQKKRLEEQRQALRLKALKEEQERLIAAEEQENRRKDAILKAKHQESM